LGYKQLTVSSWVGVSAPKGTPAPIVRKLHAALQAAINEPAVVKLLEFQGMTPAASTPEQYAQLVRGDTERWGQLVRSLNIKAN
jgi:tripartite-type tricarboxylate transporter receptor subunit TctC